MVSNATCTLVSWMGRACDPMPQTWPPPLSALFSLWNVCCIMSSVQVAWNWRWWFYLYQDAKPWAGTKWWFARSQGMRTGGNCTSSLCTNVLKNDNVYCQRGVLPGPVARQLEETSYRSESRNGPTHNPTTTQKLILRFQTGSLKFVLENHCSSWGWCILVIEWCHGRSKMMIMITAVK